jgi:hypothetical protein
MYLETLTGSAGRHPLHRRAQNLVDCACPMIVPVKVVYRISHTRRTWFSPESCCHIIDFVASSPLHVAKPYCQCAASSRRTITPRIYGLWVCLLPISCLPGPLPTFGRDVVPLYRQHQADPGGRDPLAEFPSSLSYHSSLTCVDVDLS